MGTVRLKAGFFKIPSVMAALTFAGERFRFVAGVGHRDAVENVANLNAEYVCYYNQPGGIELWYADGESATYKAAIIAQRLLGRCYAYVEGGYVYRGLSGMSLTDMVDRVTVRKGPNGWTEEVDFTAERAPRVFEGQRDFERRAQLSAMFPKQAELRQEADQHRIMAATMKARPDWMRRLQRAFGRHFGIGNIEPEPAIMETAASESATLPAGTPVWKAPMTRDEPVAKHTRAVKPSAVTAEHSVFCGLTVHEAELVSLPHAVVRTGYAVARVLGPVSSGDALGRRQEGYALENEENDYLMKAEGTGSVGIAMADVDGDGPTELIPVYLGVGGSGGGGEAVWA